MGTFFSTLLAFIVDHWATARVIMGAAGIPRAAGQVLSTMHVHLDDRLCLELLALRGRPADLRHLADGLIGLKGVKHGQLVVSSARLWKDRDKARA